MKKQIIVFGDIEMGAGNLSDDFISDKTLSRLIRNFAQRQHPIDLVLNGDIFDFLKCPSQLNPTIYPRHITKEVSLAKLGLIYQAHQEVFQALRYFAAQKDKAIYFIIGNHDHDLYYHDVQQEIQRLLQSTEKVRFPGLKYEESGVYIEHGHQYDFLFQINFENLFLNHKGQSLLNFPFVTFGLISSFMKMKEEHPFLERIFPRPELFTHHRLIAKKVTKRTLGYFLKSLLYYPFRFYSDPTYSFPTDIFREFYKRIRNINFDVDDITTIFRRKTRRAKDKIYVLGHIHEKRLAKSPKRVIIHPGSWRDEYDLQPKTRELLPRTKRYVEINLAENGELGYELIDTFIKRSIFDFDEVLKDELKFIEQAAAEEEFALQKS